MEGTPGRTLTPGLSRKKSLGLALQEPQLTDHTKDLDIDDGLDKRRRHQDMLAEKKRKNMSTSFNMGASNGDSSLVDSAVSNMSDSKLAELYATSLKLSAENKINNTNAFALPIIDVFARMLKSPSFAHNFQMTSRSLDASAKVYSCRVDYVHAETFRIAGELAISTKKRKKDDCSPEEEDDDLAPQEKRRKKKDRKKSKTIETNLKNLDQTKQLEDLCILMIDPLFNQMSMLFSEEGVNGLIFNNATQDNTFLIPLDSRQRVSRNLEEEVGTPFTYRMEHEFLNVINSKFADCFHIGFSLDEPNQPNLISSKNQSMEAQAVLQKSLSQISFDMDAGEDMAPDMPEDDVPLDDEVVFKAPLAPAGTLNDEVAPVEITQADPTNMTSLLAAEPGEYSYLDDQLVSAWAGPDYWKFHHPSLRSSQDTQSKGSLKKEGAKKKLVTQREYCLQVDKKALLNKGTTSLELARSTLLNWDRKKTTYPRDIRYHSSQLHRLGHKQRLKLFTEDKPSTEEERNEATDYEDNFEEEEEDMFNPQVDDGLLPDPPGDLSVDEEDIPESQQPVFSQEPPLTQENYDPSLQAHKLNLNYAKRAKRIDVKNLKTNMWKLLASDKPHVPNLPVPDKMSKEMTFTDLYSQLPSHVTEANAESLTVPLAFVCFLHMTNEKVLELESQEDMADFKIRQG